MDGNDDGKNENAGMSSDVGYGNSNSAGSWFNYDEVHH